jgi:hypothetical protein
MIRIAVTAAALRLRKPDEPVPLAVALGNHGGDRRSEKVKDQGAVGTLKRGSNSRAYLEGRLQRDHPDIAAMVAAERRS